MVKGASIKFTSYEDAIKLLTALKIDKELKKFDKIVLKPFLRDSNSPSTSSEFTEAVLRFVLYNKNPVAEVFIAEGSDGEDTMELFEKKGYKKLAEKFSIGLIDLNDTELEEITHRDFTKFQSINYPRILKESFVISLPILAEDEELEIIDSLSNMVGAFPSSHYSGFFTRRKSKIRKNPMKYSVHDINMAKLPNFSVIDASQKGLIFAGLPIHVDKRAAHAIDLDWKGISHIKLLDSNLSEEEKEKVF